MKMLKPALLPTRSRSHTKPSRFTRILSSPLLRLSLFTFAVLCFLVPPAEAQLNGFNIKGDKGLKSGTQAAPGSYLGLSVHWYRTDRINDRFGDQVNLSGDLNRVLGGPTFQYVSDRKFLGANYSFLISVPFVNARLEGPRFVNNPGPGISDIYIQPISLGWHFDRIDVTTAYGFFAPTGRYNVGVGANRGLGMWGHEFSIGATVYLSDDKAWHFASTAAFEFHSKKDGIPAQVGNIITLEGGIGRDIFSGNGSFGLAYYVQGKISSDNLTGITPFLVGGRNRTAALGPEINLPLIARRTLFAVFTVRYQFEVFSRSATQGNSLYANLNFYLNPVSLAAPPPPNSSPVVSCSAARTSVFTGSNDAVSVRASASDPDNDTLTYTWSASAGSVSGTGAEARWDSTGLAAGRYTVTARVDDGRGGTATCSADIAVEPKPNAIPTMSCSADRSSVLVGERVRISARAADADNDSLTYTWRASGGQILGSGADVQLDTTGLAPGTYSVSGRVEDGKGGAADCTTSIGVTVPPPPPQASKLSECLFRGNSARVDNVCKRFLDDVALRLQSDTRATIVLVGYADPGERAADRLATSRASAAAKYLAEKGIAEARIHQRTAGGQAGAGNQNRRVDIIWVPEGATF